MIKLCKKEQLEELKAKYSKEMIQEAEEIIRLLCYQATLQGSNKRNCCIC